jgi:hypothetical protein
MGVAYVASSVGRTQAICFDLGVDGGAAVSEGSRWCASWLISASVGAVLGGSGW